MLEVWKSGLMRNAAETKFRGVSNAPIPTKVFPARTTRGNRRQYPPTTRNPSVRGRSATRLRMMRAAMTMRKAPMYRSRFGAWSASHGATAALSANSAIVASAPAASVELPPPASDRAASTTGRRSAAKREEYRSARVSNTPASMALSCCKRPSSLRRNATLGIDSPAASSPTAAPHSRQKRSPAAEPAPQDVQ